MDDLSALSKVLKGAANSGSAGEDDSFISLVEKNLDSIDPAVRVSVVETLAEVLEELDIEATQRLLEDAALSLIRRLIPFAPRAPAARTVVDSITSHSRPKEVLLALSEALSHIEEELIRGQGLSDEEDDFEDESSEEDLVEQLVLVVEAHVKIVSRLNLTRSTPTLLALTDSLHNVLPPLTGQIDISAARTLLFAVLDLVSAAWRWVGGTSDKGGEQRAMLSQLLHMAIALLSPRIEARLAERWFVEWFPKYKGLHADDGDWKPAQDILDKANAVAAELDISPADLLDALTHPSSTSPYASLSALTLITASLPPLPLTHAVDHTISATPPDLADCIPILTAALSSSAIDAGLAYTWALLHQDLTVSVPYDNATMLIELLVPLAARPPSPTSRTLLFKLIATLIASTPSAEDQIMLYKQLLEPENPFEQVRVTALSLLRDGIASSKPSLSTSLSAPSTTTAPSLLVPPLLDHLAPVLYTIPTSTAPLNRFLSADNRMPVDSLAPPLLLKKGEIVETMYPAWFTDCANVLRVLIQRDEANASGVRGKAWLAQVKTEWIAPQVVKTTGLRTEKEDDAQVEFVLERWVDALERLQDTVDAVLP